MIGRLLIPVFLAALPVGAFAADPATGLPEGAWEASRSGALPEKTLRLRLAPDPSGLGPAERAAVDKLLKTGRSCKESARKSRSASTP